MTEFIGLLELIGTVAFSVSGAVIACGAGLDIFGVTFVGCITAFGGGIVRDILLGINPPTIFSNGRVFLIAVITSLLVFILAYINRRKFDFLKTRIEMINDFFDAIGLAAFSVAGAEVCFINGYSDNPLLIIISGMITGVGGGIFRDVLIDTTPYIFKKRIYALASIFGSFIYYILRNNMGSLSGATAVAVFFVVVIRMLAMRFRWSLPKIRQ